MVCFIDIPNTKVIVNDKYMANEAGFHKQRHVYLTAEAMGEESDFKSNKWSCTRSSSI